MGTTRAGLSAVGCVLLSLSLQGGCARNGSGGASHPPGRPSAAEPQATSSSEAETEPRGESDAQAAVSAARQFSRAVAAGDLERAKALLYTPTAAHEKLADAVARQFIAEARLRAAAMRRLGEAEGKRLPMNDAGTVFQNRMSAEVQGERARVTWLDDYGPYGTERDLDLQRVGRQWEVSMRRFTSGDQPETVRHVLDAIGDVNWYTRRLLKVVDEIESGKLKTFDDINKAA